MVLVHYSFRLFSRLYGLLLNFFDAHFLASKVLFDGAFLKGEMLHLTVVQLFRVVLFQFFLFIFHDDVSSSISRIIKILTQISIPHAIIIVRIILL